jgi:putative membrane protein
MMVTTKGSFMRVLAWQWRACLLFIGTGVVAWIANDILQYEHADLPALPSSVIGAALGIFASFRVNAAYSRWWEGRGLWGRIVNASRTLSSQVTAYVDDAALARTVIQRHALWVHVLRCQLRDDDPFADEHVQRALDRLGLTSDEHKAELKKQTSLCHHLSDLNLRALARSGVEPLRLQAMDQSIATLTDAQGGCERIKRTPMPRGYSFFVQRLLLIFSVLFPFTIVEDVGWACIPLNLVVCIGFTLISETGRVLEDPFTHFWNSLPITNISINIERNVRQRLGDADLPAATTPDGKGILY